MNPEEISVEEIMRRIREEVRRRRFLVKEIYGEEAPGDLSLPEFQPELEPLSLPTEPLEMDKDTYHLNDFLKYHDLDFVVNAYRGLLKREPDPEGLAHYLSQLRTGRMSKVEILARIRFSPEGKSKGVKVRGLLIPLAFNLSYKVPVLGYFSRLLVGLGSLPILIKNFERFEAFENFRWREWQDRLHRNQERISASFQEVGRQLLSFWEAFSERLERLRKDLETRPRREDLEELKAPLEKVLSELSLLKEREADLATVSRLEALEERLSLLEKREREVLEEVREEIARLSQRLSSLEEEVSLKAGGEELEERLSELSAHLSEELGRLNKQILVHKRHIVDMERRLFLLLEEARKRLPEPISQEQIREMLREEDHLLDALYVSLEDRFRGTREDIKERLRIYLPYVQETLEKVGGGLVLDVGCGRGEWLELLKENGIEAIGLDLNRVMIDQCRELGLEVIEAEALDYLRGQKGNTFAVITGFHLVEHLPLKKMIALFDECLRVLKPGGMVIFETPNPENILVGACYFYLDPTHRNPLPEELLLFLLEERGFERLKTLKGQPFLIEGDPPLANYFNAPRDYAILGYKP